MKKLVIALVVVIVILLLALIFFGKQLAFIGSILLYKGVETKMDTERRNLQEQVCKDVDYIVREVSCSILSDMDDGSFEIKGVIENRGVSLRSLAIAAVGDGGSSSSLLNLEESINTGEIRVFGSGRRVPFHFSVENIVFSPEILW